MTTLPCTTLPSTTLPSTTLPSTTLPSTGLLNTALPECWLTPQLNSPEVYDDLYAEANVLLPAKLDSAGATGFPATSVTGIPADGSPPPPRWSLPDDPSGLLRFSRQTADLHDQAMLENLYWCLQMFTALAMMVRLFLAWEFRLKLSV
eukprot:1311355-Pyramimonas_sp.AAC.1